MTLHVKEKFAPVIQHFEEIVTNSRRLGKFSSVDQILRLNHQTTAHTGKIYILVDASCLLGLPILATEQYPRYFFLHKYIRWRDGYLSIEMIFNLSQGSGCDCGRPQIEGDEQTIIISSTTLVFLISSVPRNL